MNQNNWKEFKIGEIFSLENCKCGNAGELISGNDLLYIGAKKNENGVMKKVAYDSNLISNGNCIVFICDGQGSVGYCNYMDREFIGSTTLTAGYNKNLNRYNAMFIVTVLDKERFKYSYGRKYRPHLQNTKVKLPEKEGAPDWIFMENFIKQLKSENILTENSQSKNILETHKWQDFRLESYFKIVPGKYHSSDNYDIGTIPYVSASNINNGISQYINLEPDFKGNCIITGKVGCTAFYQPNDFCATSDVNVFIPKNFVLNKYIGLFLVSVINKSENYKWNYGRQCRVGDSKEIIVKLPTKNNQPDWQYMEEYIKSLPYGDRI